MISAGVATFLVLPPVRGQRAGHRHPPEHLRGSAFGMLATVQAASNVIASAIAGLLYTIASPGAAFGCITTYMTLAGFAWTAKPTTP